MTDKMAKALLELVQVDFDTTHGVVCKIAVEPSLLTRVFLRIDGNDEAFFVRAGNQTVRLSPSETLKYIERGKQIWHAATHTTSRSDETVGALG
jgi:hypothetical protein